MKTPIYHTDSKELLGYIVVTGGVYQATTIFGYQISLTTSHAAAEKILRDQGGSYLSGIWQYYDNDELNWYPCVIKDAFEHRVIVNRTNDLGYINPDNFKQVVINHPSEEIFVKTT